MSDKEMIKAIGEEAVAFNHSDDLDTLVNAIGDAQYVLLGEASHGTSEFYTTRAELTKKLIEEKGFHFIAVEGDWPSCYKVNRYIKGYDKVTAHESLMDFNRWPTWMWANEEILSLVKWLQQYNTSQEEKVGFYGVDVYSLWESMDEILRSLEKSGTHDIETARKAFECFEAFDRRPEYYGVSAAFYGEDCTDEVVKMLFRIRENKHLYTHEEEAALDLSINSLVTLNAEAYYRTMVKGGPEDWNIRDQHMVSAIEEIRDFYGEDAKDAKVIVWEHNTHIGDARATDMAEEGLLNVGQVLREKYGNKVFAIGFGTNRGTVIAARKWGEEIETMPVPKAVKGSWEDLMHQAGPTDKILIFNEENRHRFNAEIGHRAIGVVYNPEHEHMGNYVPSRVSERYDAFIYIEETKALHPLKVKNVTV